MNTWNGKSILVHATVADIKGFVLNMDKKVRCGMHVKECGNLKRSFIGHYRATTNLYHGMISMAPCCRQRAWDRLWPVIKEDKVYKKIVAEETVA